LDLSASPTRLSCPTYRCASFYVKLDTSPCGRYVASGSTDGGVYIWDLEEMSHPPLILDWHALEVTAVAWCPSDIGQVCF